MFITLDTATARTKGASTSPAAIRACDQCKARKVRCDMNKPCATCIEREFVCSYDKARKKRGPPGKRIADIRRQQNSSTDQPTAFSTFSAAADDRTTAKPPTPGSSNHQSALSPLEQEYTNNDTNQSTSQVIDFNDRMTDSMNHSITSPDDGEFIFPSLPIESPSSTVFDDFGSIPQRQDHPIPQMVDIWPSEVNEGTLLPWIDVYFKRLHPTIPILNRANMYCEMLLRKHRSDPQYGAMLLGLCAFAMEQPVQIHERSMKASRSVQSRMLLQECAKMRVSANFGEHPTIEMILTSFFMFACLFGAGEHKAARHRLREAVDLAYSLGLHLPQSYQGLAPEAREQWLRTYLVLSVTERAYALQQSHSISFRGRPGVTARFMNAFDASTTSEYISSLLFQDQSQTDAISMTSLLYLMDTFDTIDESLMDCWNGFCPLSDGICSAFDRRRALQMFRSQSRIRDACMEGNISFAPSVTPLPLAQLLESQRADISVTQLWLLNRLWHLCFSHGLLRESSEHPELRFDFACRIAQALLTVCNSLSLASMEVHGLGFLMKVYDVAAAIVTAVQASSTLQADSRVSFDPEESFPGYAMGSVDVTVQDQLRGFARLMDYFRGGDHEYKAMLEGITADIPGMAL